jgi:hypothetical protein
MRFVALQERKRSGCMARRSSIESMVLICGDSCVESSSWEVVGNRVFVAMQYDCNNVTIFHARLAKLHSFQGFQVFTGVSRSIRQSRVTEGSVEPAEDQGGPKIVQKPQKRPNFRSECRNFGVSYQFSTTVKGKRSRVTASVDLFGMHNPSTIQQQQHRQGILQKSTGSAAR